MRSSTRSCSSSLNKARGLHHIFHAVKELPLQSPSEAFDYRSKLQLFNTMKRSKQSFTTRPDKPNNVQMYVCGVTVYDFSHIGHARVYVAFDILYRLLSQVLGYQVQYVRNFTDIDDKIIKRANERGEDPLALSQRFITEFHKDMEHLNCLPPTFEPKATDFIPEMIATIEMIIRNGHAYAVDGGDVFFEVDSLPGYGCLSGRSQDDNRAGERVDVDPRKRGPADFALWKSVRAGEPAWPSPWGPGRPGWHIECSSMIEKVMGRVIDIHGGGRDLVFPHHENELAQSRAAAGPASCGCGSEAHVHHDDDSLKGEDEFVRYWMHNGFVNVDSEKMSKSLGNFFTIRDVIQKYHPMALRWFLVNTQYRQQVNYTQRALDESSDRIYYAYQSLIDISQALDSAGEEGSSARKEAASASCSISHAAILALVDDLNTPSAVSELSIPLKQANDLLTTKAGKKQVGRLVSLAKIENGMKSVLYMLGLLPSESNSVTSQVLTGFIDEMKKLALVRWGIDEAFVASCIKERAEARQAKDFQRADEVRIKLSSLGVILKDAPEGTTWMPGTPS